MDELSMASFLVVVRIIMRVLAIHSQHSPGSHHNVKQICRSPFLKHILIYQKE